MRQQRQADKSSDSEATQCVHTKGSNGSLSVCAAIWLTTHNMPTADANLCRWLEVCFIMPGHRGGIFGIPVSRGGGGLQAVEAAGHDQLARQELRGTAGLCFGVKCCCVTGNAC